MSEFLFVYGTLRRAAGHPMHRALLREAEFVGLAGLPGRLYDLGSYPGAVPDAAARGRIAGELYRLPRPQAVLPPLDRYEGCTAPGDQTVPAPSEEYRRVVCRVLREDGGSTAAWVYVYNQPCGGLVPIESGDYLNR